LRFVAWALLVAVITCIHISLSLQLSGGLPPPQRAVSISRIRLSPAMATPKEEPAERVGEKRPQRTSPNATDRSVPPPKPPSPENAQTRSASLDETAPSPSLSSTLHPLGESTNRLEYSVSGQNEGQAFSGSARLLWSQTDSGYKAIFEMAASQRYSLLFSLRMESEGRVTPAGLVSDHFKEELQPPGASTSTPLASGNPAANGAVLVQDPLSSFLQLRHLLTSALAHDASSSGPPASIELQTTTHQLVFDTEENETLFTPFGEVETLRLSLRPVPGVDPRLQIHTWVSPRFEYRPMRLRIDVGAGTHLELSIAQMPLTTP